MHPNQLPLKGKVESVPQPQNCDFFSVHIKSQTEMLQAYNSTQSFSIGQSSQHIYPIHHQQDLRLLDLSNSTITYHHHFFPYQSNRQLTIFHPRRNPQSLARKSYSYLASSLALLFTSPLQPLSSHQCPPQMLPSFLLISILFCQLQAILPGCADTSQTQSPLSHLRVFLKADCLDFSHKQADSLHHPQYLAHSPLQGDQKLFLFPPISILHSTDCPVDIAGTCHTSHLLQIGPHHESQTPQTHHLLLLPLHHRSPPHHPPFSRRADRKRQDRRRRARRRRRWDWVRRGRKKCPLPRFPFAGHLGFESLLGLFVEAVDFIGALHFDTPVKGGFWLTLATVGVVR